MPDGRRKVRLGEVVSDKMDKTVLVAVRWQQRHRLYKKSIRRITRFFAHDRDNECRIGDMVRIEETRPLSRMKKWRVVEIVQRREVAEVKPAELDEGLLTEEREQAAAQAIAAGPVDTAEEDAAPESEPEDAAAAMDDEEYVDEMEEDADDGESDSDSEDDGSEIQDLVEDEEGLEEEDLEDDQPEDEQPEDEEPEEGPQALHEEESVEEEPEQQEEPEASLEEDAPEEDGADAGPAEDGAAPVDGEGDAVEEEERK